MVIGALFRRFSGVFVALSSGVSRVSRMRLLCRFPRLIPGLCQDYAGIMPGLTLVYADLRWFSLACPETAYQRVPKKNVENRARPFVSIRVYSCLNASKRVQKRDAPSIQRSPMTQSSSEDASCSWHFYGMPRSPGRCCWGSSGVRSGFSLFLSLRNSPNNNLQILAN